LQLQVQSVKWHLLIFKSDFLQSQGLKSVCKIVIFDFNTVNFVFVVCGINSLSKYDIGLGSLGRQKVK